MTLQAYRDYKRGHTREDAFPGGESLNDAARRYAEATSGSSRPRTVRVLVVCHEIPLRYALNGALESDDLDGPVHQLPNATPFLFAASALARAVETIRRLTPASADIEEPRSA